jgi:hypothetical protein
MNGKVLLFKLALVAAVLSATGCASVTPLSPAPTPDIAPTEMLIPTTAPSTEAPLVVAFVKGGNIELWESATGQSRTFVNSGDIVSVWISDDGQVIAFTRREWVGDILDGFEQLSLWAINRDGGNPRELVPAQDLRQRLTPDERESTNFFQLDWIPQTHELIFTGTKYIVQAEGLSHAIPQGAYVVNTDTGSITVLAEPAENLRLVPSSNGGQIALMSPGGLSFINKDGSNRRQNVLTYPAAGIIGPLFPTGAWTRDSSAFVVTASFERDPNMDVNFTFWRVPVDGSPAETLAAVTKSHPDSVTFSPDGRYASFFKATDSRPTEIAGWFITPFSVEVGPLAIPYYGKEAFYANLHWSPAGEAFVINDHDLVQLCPDATQDSQVCGGPIHLGIDSNIITSLQWVDGERFLVAGIEPNTLSLGRLDGTLTPIITWADNEMPGWSMSTAPGR